MKMEKELLEPLRQARQALDSAAKIDDTSGRFSNAVMRYYEAHGSPFGRGEYLLAIGWLAFGTSTTRN